MVSDIIHIYSNNAEKGRQRLDAIADALHKSRRCLIVTGAGISVGGGVPDFRSSEGLYQQIKEQYNYNSPFIRGGADMFNARVLADPTTRSIFFTFIGKLKALVDEAKPSRVHQFIKNLMDRNQLLRCYTQNIDGLEERVQLPMPEPGCAAGDKLVQLHGALSHLKCTVCTFRPKFTAEYVNIFMEGEAPACPDCILTQTHRETCGRRAMPTGDLWPNITMYDESNIGEGEAISTALREDLKRGKPDLVLVMGTSLKVDGIKVLVKDVAHTVHSLWRKEQSASQISTQNSQPSQNSKSKASSWRGQVIYINKTILAQKEWDGVIDLQVQGNADEICTILKDELIRRDGLLAQRKGSKLCQRSLSFPVQKPKSSNTSRTTIQPKSKLSKTKSESRQPARRTKKKLEQIHPAPPDLKKRKLPTSFSIDLPKVQKKADSTILVISPEKRRLALPLTPSSPIKSSLPRSRKELAELPEPEVHILSPVGTRSGRAKLPTPTESDMDKNDADNARQTRSVLTRTQSERILRSRQAEVVVVSPGAPSPSESESSTEFGIESASLKSIPASRRQRLVPTSRLHGLRRTQSAILRPVTPENDDESIFSSASRSSRGHPSPVEMRHPACRRGLLSDPESTFGSSASTMLLDSDAETLSDDSELMSSSDLSDAPSDDDDELMLCRAKGTRVIHPLEIPTRKNMITREILHPSPKKPQRTSVSIPLPEREFPTDEISDSSYASSPDLLRDEISFEVVPIVDLITPSTAGSDCKFVAEITPRTRTRFGGLPPMEIPIATG